MATPTESPARRPLQVRLSRADFHSACKGFFRIEFASQDTLRRLDIPKEMQKKFGSKPLGPADGPMKRAILGENNARLYNFSPEQRSTLENDRFAQLKEDYLKNGADRSNLTYGYIHKPKA